MIYLVIAIVVLVIILVLMAYKTIKSEDRNKKISFILVGLIFLILALVFFIVESRNGTPSLSESETVFPWFILAPIWVSLALNQKKDIEDQEEKSNKILLTVLVIGLLFLFLGTTLYLLLS